MGLMIQSASVSWWDLDGLDLSLQNLGEKDKIGCSVCKISIWLLLQCLILEAVFVSGTFRLPAAISKHEPSFFYLGAYPVISNQA